MDKKLVPSVAHENLRTLCILRLIPLAGMFYGVYYLLQERIENLQWDFIFALLATLILVIGFTWLRSFHATAIRQGEFFGHLVIDIGIYSLLMFNTGGASNPFISYLLVPITIAAIALPPSLTWLTGAICLCSYSLLLFWHIPLPAVAPGHHMSGAHHGSALNLHVIGMWLNFMVSALLIAYFVNKMARTIAAQEQAINRQHQQQLENEQLLAVATIAASAAHELGTPLNTMKLISDEWVLSDGGLAGEEFAQDLDIFKKQIDRCQQTLQKLAGTAREYSGKGERSQNVQAFFNDLIESWLVMRPDVRAKVNVVGQDADAAIHYHPSLSASIHNLLNNAGDASPEQIDIDIEWNADTATMTILDQGDGIHTGLTGESPLTSEKPSGMGLGLYLARFILARHHASVTMEPRQGTKGTMTRITLPLRPGNDRSA